MCKASVARLSRWQKRACIDKKPELVVGNNEEEEGETRGGDLLPRASTHPCFSGAHSYLLKFSGSRD